MGHLKSYFISVVLSLLIMPGFSLANYGDAVRILEQAKAIESSAGNLLINNPSLKQSLDSLYRAILDMLKTEFLNIKTSVTTSINFSPLVSPLNKGSVITISFNRVPEDSSSSLNFYIETGDGRLVGSLANEVLSNSVSWQVSENFVVGKKYRIIAKNGQNKLLGKTADFTVATRMTQSLSLPVTQGKAVSSVSLPVSYAPSAEEISSADINRGSIGLWSFDKYSNNCDTKGGAVTNAEGKIGSALGLNGLDAYCRVSNNRNLYPKYFTLALWARSDSSHANSWNDSGWFVSLRDQSGFNIGPIKDSKNVQFTILDDTNLVQNSYVVGTFAMGSITDWHHFAITYDGSVANVYLDGVLATSTKTAISRGYAGNKDFYFGSDNTEAAQHFGSGTLDEIRLYNRPLSTCEIQILAGKGCGGLSLSSFSNKNTASIFSGVKSIPLRPRSLIE